MRLIDADALRKTAIWAKIRGGMIYETDAKVVLVGLVDTAPTIDAVPVAEIKDYLQKRLDEWEALGDRRFEPANMWGYNFIMACFDDLERKDGGS